MTNSVIKSEASSAKILWAVAASPYPVTTADVCDLTGMDRTHRTDRSRVADQLKRLYDTGLVDRRQLSYQGAPLEYVINPDLDVLTEV